MFADDLLAGFTRMVTVAAVDGLVLIIMVVGREPVEVLFIVVR